MSDALTRRADGGVPSEPGELAVGAAIDRFLKKRQTDSTDRTLRSYRDRLTTFEDWCLEQKIGTVGELTAWHLDEYDLAIRDSDFAPTTIKGLLATLRVFLKYAERIGAVEEDLHESVDVPSLSRSQESSDERLAEEDATAALAFFRNSRTYFGVPMHAFLELGWNTGARMGGLRALDLGDYDAGEQSLEFVHRPDTDTPLKNKRDGERKVGIPDAVVECLETYLARERSDKRDDYGREPLFCARQGRPSWSTLRAWSYQSTHPCLWMECPHGKRRESCEWTQRSHASKCPSSRSPHRVRKGSITWQLNQGMPIEHVATRVNASVDVIKRFYDTATKDEEFEQRRRAAETALDIGGAEEEDDQ